MIHHRLLRSFLLALLLLTATGKATASAVVVLTVDGAINPGTADYIVRGLKYSAENSAQLVVLKMDTPGGLDISMRQIIKEIIASPVPVAAFVSPEGARAASAGTYILYACHIAAMAPATNLGAATPIMIGFTRPDGENQPAGNGKSAATATDDAMERKQVNDAAAYIRSLAQMRGRNVEWAELAVRQAVSLSSLEALKLKVIEVIAPDVPELLRRLDGREVNVAGGKKSCIWQVRLSRRSIRTGAAGCYRSSPTRALPTCCCSAAFSACFSNSPIRDSSCQA